MKGLQTLYNEWVMYEYKSSVKYDDVLKELFKLLPDKDKNDIDQLQPAYVATTNYTPFVSLLGCEEENTSYLVGELSLLSARKRKIVITTIAANRTVLPGFRKIQIQKSLTTQK